MKRRTKFVFMVGGVVFVALFIMRWNASGPFRMRRQFESQAIEQLRGTVLNSGETFSSIRIYSFEYRPVTNEYIVRYELNYAKASNGRTIPLWHSCELYQRGSENFRGKCSATALHGLYPKSGKSSVEVKMLTISIYQ